MAEGIFYQDTLQPFNTADFAAVTLATTSKQLWTPADFSPTKGGNYWWPGKIMHLRCFGRFTSAATPGNLTIEVRYATADAGGTILATSAALTWIASQANMSWRFEGYITCRATGTAGSLFASGIFECNTAAIAVGQAAIPATAPAAVAVDTTVASGISLQFKRSGSTAETAQVHQLVYSALN